MRTARAHHRPSWGLLAATFSVAIGLLLPAGCDGSTNRGDPDPGGKVLAALETIEHAVPPNAVEVDRDVRAAKWDSCDGRADTFGWSDLGVYIRFRFDGSPDDMVAGADAALQAEGWSNRTTAATPLGPFVSWSRQLDDVTVVSARLGPTTTDGVMIRWELTAQAPPKGQRVSGC